MEPPPHEAAGAPAPDSSDDVAGLGLRLAAQEQALRLSLAHLAGRALRARIELDDLQQEVYLRALAARGLPAPEADGDETPLRRFLTRLARNVVVDAARALRAAKRDGTEERLERSAWSRAGRARLAAPRPGPATQAAAQEGIQRLVAAFEGLAPEHRRVLGLRQFEGLSARETAGRMGRSETAVHSLYRRALLAWEAAAEPDAGRGSAARPG